jgi:hypothetical protein
VLNSKIWSVGLRKPGQVPEITRMVGVAPQSPIHDSTFVGRITRKSGQSAPASGPVPAFFGPEDLSWRGGCPGIDCGGPTTPLTNQRMVIGAVGRANACRHRRLTRKSPDKNDRFRPRINCYFELPALSDAAAPNIKNPSF